MKTLFLIIIAVLVTVIVMQNTEPVLFKILWIEASISKLWVMLGLALFGFILGVIVARPRIKSPVTNTEPYKNVPLEINNADDEDYIYPDNKKTLSDEDRDYIS